MDKSGTIEGQKQEHVFCFYTKISTKVSLRHTDIELLYDNPYKFPSLALESADFVWKIVQTATSLAPNLT